MYEIFSRHFFSTHLVFFCSQKYSTFRRQWWEENTIISVRFCTLHNITSFPSEIKIFSLLILVINCVQRIYFRFPSPMTETKVMMLSSQYRYYSTRIQNRTCSVISQLSWIKILSVLVYINYLSWSDGEIIRVQG